MSLCVAFRVPHNEGIIKGVITAAGFDSETALVDLYEVDAQIRAFGSREDAEDWLAKPDPESDTDDDLDWKNEHVPGGVIMRAEY